MMTLYFFRLLDSVMRIAEPNYSPTQNDILFSRVRTTGVVELQFTIEDVKFKYAICYSLVSLPLFTVCLQSFRFRWSEVGTKEVASFLPGILLWFKLSHTYLFVIKGHIGFTICCSS